MNKQHRMRAMNSYSELGEFILEKLQDLRDEYLWFCIKTMFGKEGMIMMAMFFAQRVILGKTEFKDVPIKLQPGCAEILIDSGLAELVPTEFGGTATETTI